MSDIYKATWVLFLCMVLANTSFSQRNFFVKTSALPAGSGASWDDPIPLASALKAADNADTVRVAEGTYIPSLSEIYTDTTGKYYRGTFALKAGVVLLGGYPLAASGNDTSSRTFFSTTILNGDLFGNDGVNFSNREDNVVHVVVVSTSADSLPTIVNGFTIRGGNGKYLGPVNLTQPVDTADDGGVVGGLGAFVLDTYHGLHGNGILVLNNNNATQGRVVISNCVVTDNQADQGINNAQNGHSQARGAGISVENNAQEGCNIHVTIFKTQVLGNRTKDSLLQSTAQDPPSGVAGIYIMTGVSLEAGKCILIMDSCQVKDNVHLGTGPSDRTLYGAGLRFGSSLTGSSISHSVFANNTITATGNEKGYSAGIDLYATITISSCEIINNAISAKTAIAVGAGMYLGKGTTIIPTCTIINTTIAGNTTNTPVNLSYGVGMYLYGNCIIQNSTLSSNKILAASNPRGGTAIGSSSPSLQLVTTTIANNTGSEAVTISNVNFTMDNTLFTGNTTLGGATSDIVYGGTVTKNYSYSIADGVYYRTATADIKNIAVMPAIAPLAYNGGFGQTHLLLNNCDPRNPAINTGNPTYNGVTDQDLVNRFFAPWNPSIGAVEFPLRADTLLPDTTCATQFQWQAADLFGRQLTYNVLNPAEASITPDGQITNLSAGSTFAQVTNGTEVFCAPLTVHKKDQTIEAFVINVPPCTNYGYLIELPATTSTGETVTYEITEGLNTVATQYSANEIKVISSGALAVRGFNTGNDCNNAVESLQQQPVSVNPLFLGDPVYNCNSTNVTVNLDDFSSHSSSYTYEAFNIQPLGTAPPVTSGNTSEVVTLPAGTTSSAFRVTDNITGCLTEMPDFVFGCALPVKWLDFYGNSAGEVNVLTWKVTSETQVLGYEVERSEDGMHFSSIGKVAFNDNGGLPNVYQFTDALSGRGKMFYRIKQLDLDGGYEYSKTIILDRNITSIIMRSYPNPFNGQLQVAIESPVTGGKILIKLLNATGQQAWERSDLMNGKTYQFTENTTNLASGTYWLRVTYENRQHIITKTFKLVKTF